MYSSLRFTFLILFLATLTACATTQSNTTEQPDTPILEQEVTPPVTEITPAPEETPAEAVETPPTNIWDRVRAGFAIPEQSNARIDTQLKWYTKHPKYINRVCERARPFLYDIVNVLEENNIPLEIALLPVVESAFQPFAYSSGRAAGLWQFIPSTGKLLGLKQNWWYDGRRDAYLSTRAAAKYLLQLNKMLQNDWLYSLAGYNAGPGNVRKAVRKNKKRNKPVDYWNLRLPDETKAYVPKLLALKRIVADPERYGVTLCDIPNEPQLELVQLTGQIDLAIAADTANLTLDELHKLNPGFNRWATSPTGPHHLLLPLENAQSFKEIEPTLNESARLRWKQHKVKSGETLSHIAEKYGTTVTQIKRSNNLRNNNIRVSQRLLIPTSSKHQKSYSLSADQRLQKKHNSSGKNKAFHTVQSGDSWWSIAKKHGVNMKTLARWNGKSHLDTLSIGQKLVVFNSKNATTSPNGSALIQKVRYPVRRGDSLYTIAQKFKVRVSQIASWNGISKQKYLQPGQQLVLYVDIRNQ